MAARLTDKQKKQIMADYAANQSYNATAKIHGLTIEQALALFEKGLSNMDDETFFCTLGTSIGKLRLKEKECRKMGELKAFNFNQVDVVDSREVAELVEKQHKNLLRDIDGYIETMKNSTELKIEPSDFFIKSAYKDSTGRTLPCYL